MNSIDKYSITGDRRILLEFVRKVENVFNIGSFTFLSDAIAKTFGENTFITSELKSLFKEKGKMEDVYNALKILDVGQDLGDLRPKAKDSSLRVLEQTIRMFNTPCCTRCGGIGDCSSWCNNLIN